MAISNENKLFLYRKALAKYEAEGDEEKIAIQKRMIERVKRDMAKCDA